MKILIYVWSLSNGGAERVAALWANGFVKEGHDVSVVLESFMTKNDYGVSEKVKVLTQSRLYNIIQGFLPQKLKNSRLCVKLLNKVFFSISETSRQKCMADVIKKELPDVIVIVTQNFFHRIKGALRFCDLNVPVIVTDHYGYERPAYAPFTKEEEREKFVDVEQYDFMTVLTEADKYVLMKKMHPDILNKTFVLPNPLAFKPVEVIPQKEKVIFAAGRLESWFCKGFDTLLDAWSIVQKEFPDWKLKIAGGGDSSTLRKKCSDLAIVNRVEFLGFVDIKEYYKRAEVFVLSSRYEGFGMVLIEAMSQGCACIACDFRGRQREIICDDSQGVICHPDDKNELANALRKVLSDEKFRRDLQINAIERSKYYELPNIMKCWNEIFNKVGLIKD